MKVSIIGSGNVGWHLAIAFENHHHTVCEVFSRDRAKAEKLSAMLYKATAKTDLDFSESDAELFFLSVSDDAMEEVCSKLILPENAILAHTSGSKSLDDLQKLMLIYHDLPVKCAVFLSINDFFGRETP
ncbi:MAG: NAD(P)-binding domain-containing protein [Emticicia sp.]|nr:NAD(P)-binding domain-containing protein [Emticicia sp.]